jgi:hypothetical protein
MEPDLPPELTPEEEAKFREVTARNPAPPVFDAGQKRGWIAAYTPADAAKPLVIANISARGTWRWFNPKGWVKYRRLIEQAERLMDRAQRALTIKPRRKPEFDQVYADLEAHAEDEVRKNGHPMGRPDAMDHCMKILGVTWSTASEACIRLRKARPDLMQGVGKHRQPRG